MLLILQLGALALFASLILTPAVRSVALRWKILDYPGGRKIHLCPMPRVGGVAITLAYFAAFGVFFFTGRNDRLLSHWRLAIWPLLAAIITIFMVGLMDDLLGLTHWQKLAGQLAAAGIAYCAGIRITDSHLSAAHWWSLPATLGWLLLCTNAVNLIDGVDGLAAGVGLLATTTTLLAAILQRNFQLALLTIPLIGALLGFLRFNFNPATIFLGDSGSLFIGFLLGCYSLLWSQKSTTVLGALAPLLALSVPLLDTLITIARRLSRNQSIFVADRAHLHHRLLDSGLNPRRATLLLYAFCMLGSVVSLLMTQNNYLSVAVVFIFIASWLGFRYFAHGKLAPSASASGAGPSRRTLPGKVAITSFDQSLAHSESSPLRSRARLVHKRVLDPRQDPRLFRIITGSQAVTKTKR